MTTEQKPRRYQHNDPDPVTTGKNLRAIRIDRGITQRQLAEAIGYTTPVMVTHIEKGLRGIHEDRLIVAAKFLGVAPSVIRKPSRAKR